MPTKFNEESLHQVSPVQYFSSTSFSNSPFYPRDSLPTSQNNESSMSKSFDGNVDYNSE